MTQKLDELGSEVRILKLELEKLELENRITELKDERSIDDECVGCAGPCKVVDVSANLQKELDECRKLALNESRRVQCDTEPIEKLHREYCAVIKQQKTTIEEYKETIRIERIDRAAEKTVINQKFSEDLRKKNATIEDMDSQLASRRGTIKQQHDIIEELKVKVDAFPDNYLDVVAKRDEIIKQHETTIKELKDRNIKDLHELYELDKAELDECRQIGCHNTNVLKNIINGLEDTIAELKHEQTAKGIAIANLKAELSARKEDSKVLMKVVEAVRKLTGEAGDHTNSQIMVVYHIVHDYLYAPEGPPETPIDETPNIAIVFTFGEIL